VLQLPLPVASPVASSVVDDPVDDPLLFVAELPAGRHAIPTDARLERDRHRHTPMAERALGGAIAHP